MSYNGGKGGAGVYQQIISLMPRHDLYIETHLGAGSILRHKRPAPEGSIAIEIDARVLAEFRGTFGRHRQDVRCHQVDCRDFLKAFTFEGGVEVLIYADPPYVRSTRRSARDLYRYEWTDQDHEGFLLLLKELPAFVMVSGYRCALYDDLLCGWYTHDFTAGTRHGRATETVWTNYDPARVLKADYSHVGANYRERERIQKKARRWVSNLAVLSEGERNFILQEIAAAFPREVHHHSSGLAVTAERVASGDEVLLGASAHMEVVDGKPRGWTAGYDGAAAPTEMTAWTCQLLAPPVDAMSDPRKGERA